MKLNIFRQRMGSIKIHKTAMAKQAELQDRIRKSLPKSGTEFGKSIEKKLTASQRVWSNVSIALFSDRAVDNISHHASYFLGVLMLLLTDLILIFPTDMKSLAVSAILNNLVIVFAGLIVANIVTYLAMKLLGTQTPFKVFLSTVNTAMFMGLLVISIPAALVMFAIFNTMISSKAAIDLFFSIIPFYNYLIYGWASEYLSRLKGIKAVIVALIALLIILSVNLLLGQFMI
ncbi:hypothetical protein KY363_05635 [Candidatus Woesearchaeota archaeon]|nr:hypothetical protein [Candidatus Woesearchaeota archaeon]